MALRLFTAQWDDPQTIRLVTQTSYDAPDIRFTICSDQNPVPLDLAICHREEMANAVTYWLKSPFVLDFQLTYTLLDQDHNRTEVGYGRIVETELFAQTFTYTGGDLGASYTPARTHFRFWAPISKAVLLMLDGTPYPLTPKEKGVWQADVEGDWEGASYHYLHRVNGNWLETHDPYAYSSEANAGDSYVIDLRKLQTPAPLASSRPLTQAVLYEMSVRDFSQQASLAFQYPGKFLGLTESPQIGNFSTGLVYLQKLGVTHVQLMPFYDFGSVDEMDPQALYNWGYDPVQYSVPEGSYASQPNDPYARILELQQAIHSYHQAGIGIIMDVVYNHVYNADSFAFEKIVPGYFYRYDENGQRSNGSFCGNDVASERSMVRQYILQTLKRWFSLYGIDGFRFDLMGLLDTQTMQEIAETLQAQHPDLYLYGEGWKMGTAYPAEKLAHQYNAAQMPTIGFFNDTYRDTFKRILTQPQQGLSPQEQQQIEALLAGSRNHHFLSPQQSINYLECHDNATFFDFCHIQQPQWTPQQQKRAASFGLQLLLISQGVPFLHSGQEFFRTKKELDNTYAAPDSINRLDWERAFAYQEHVAFIRDLIAFRQQHPLMAQASYDTITTSCHFFWTDNHVLHYRITSDQEVLTFVLNFADTDTSFEKEKQQIVVFCYPPLADPEQTQIQLAGQSICILQEKTSL